MDQDEKKAIIEKVKAAINRWCYGAAGQSFEEILDALLDEPSGARSRYEDEEPKSDEEWVSEFALACDPDGGLPRPWDGPAILRVVRRIRAAEIRKKAKELRDCHYLPSATKWEAEADRLEGKP